MSSSTSPRHPIAVYVPTPVGMLSITTGTRDARGWIESLNLVFSNQLGFVPRMAIVDRLQRRDYYHLRLDGEDAGYVLIGAGINQSTRISQIAVDPALWNNGIGASTVAIIRAAAELQCQPQVIADIRDDLNLIPVAKATGARLVQIRQGGKARAREIHRYAWRPVNVPRAQDRLQLAHALDSCRVVDIDTDVPVRPDGTLVLRSPSADPIIGRGNN